jgi:hypothetical protein
VVWRGVAAPPHPCPPAPTHPPAPSARPPRGRQVLRTHFHDFMLDVHTSLRKFSGDADPLLRVADGIGVRARVLALDEFFVTDVADAMILARRVRARGQPCVRACTCGCGCMHR